VADLTHDSQDDAFHEIQLSGKQLVFLFMATTVISVAIFLCGVLVGRGVRVEDIGVDPAVAAAADPAPAAQPVSTEPLATDPPSPPAEGQLSYHKRLESEKSPAEDLKPSSDPPRADPAPKAVVSAPDPKPALPSSATQGAKPGVWAVQVVSLRDGDAASQLVQRLRSKGYPAYVVGPSAGTPTRLFRVQVGRYDDRPEAQQVSARLKKEEQFDTWIVR
jgi:cell division septation protein DedD